MSIRIFLPPNSARVLPGAAGVSANQIARSDHRCSCRLMGSDAEPSGGDSASWRALGSTPSLADPFSRASFRSRQLPSRRVVTPASKSFHRAIIFEHRGRVWILVGGVELFLDDRFEFIVGDRTQHAYSVDPIFSGPANNEAGGSCGFPQLPHRQCLSELQPSISSQRYTIEKQPCRALSSLHISESSQG